MTAYLHRRIRDARERCAAALASLFPGGDGRADVDELAPELSLGGRLIRYTGAATGDVRATGPWCRDEDDAYAAAWEALASVLAKRAEAAPFVYDHRAPLHDRYRHEAAIVAASGPFVVSSLNHDGVGAPWALLDSVKLHHGWSAWGRDMHALAADHGVEIVERREWPDGRAYWTTREAPKSGTTEPATTTLYTIPAPAAEPALALRRAAIAEVVVRIGWDLHELEIDRERGRALVELRRGARIVHLRVDERGAKVERWHRGTRGEKHLKDDLWWDVPDDRFLGRESCPTIAEGVAVLTAYLVDNGNGGALPAAAFVAALGAGDAR